MFIFWLIIFLLALIGLTFLLKPLLFYQKQIPLFITEKLAIESRYWLVITITFFLPIFSISLYLYWGNSHSVAHWLMTAKQSEQVKHEIAQFGSRQKIILALQSKLQQLPRDANSAKGWYLLGKLYFNEKKFSEAVDSFRIAVELQPNNPEYLLQFISVKFYLQRKLTEQDKQLINKLLTLSPNNINAINLLALDAYQAKDFSKAIHHWESLLQFFPPEGDDAKMLLEMIRQARNQLPIHETNTSKTIQVTINISADLKNKLLPDETLFVYALELNMPRIPLAVVRVNTNHFPTTITLDSHQEMLPGRALSNADNVYVEARISKSGTAVPNKEDLVGRSKPMHMKVKNYVQITIEKNNSQ